MGTSASSKGPGGGVPMVPPWVPNPTAPALSTNGDGVSPATGDGQGDQQSPGQNQPGPQTAPEAPQLSPIAPAARFGRARRNLGNFASSGDSRDMRRGLRHYVQSGYGGGGTGVRRFGGTASTAGRLYGALSSVAGGHAPSTGSPLDPVLLAGR